jgi:glucose-6-phosphate dehydrogenase assembly protein OpcA
MEETVVPGTISPDRILKEMADLWVSLGKEGDGEAGVLRACSMTLVVAAEQSDDPTDIGETLAALMPEHPSRAILVRFQAGEERSLSAKVFSQCWMPFGQRRQICCEQIEITASDASLPDLSPVVLPLAVADLPVILWCRSPRLFHLDEFPLLRAIAGKVVLDSAAFDQPVEILRQMSTQLAAGSSLADLSWTRLTRWRELLAQIFENRAQLAALPRVDNVRVYYSGEAAPVSAYYLLAWLMQGLQKVDGRPQPAKGAISRSAGEPAGQLQRVELTAGSEMIASIALVAGHAAEVRAGALINCARLPDPTDYSLMREELSIPGRDPVFESVLAAAAKLPASQN